VRTALSRSPNSPDLQHALGLALTRLKRTEESLNEFQRAAELDPGRARYVYVYAVALNDVNGPAVFGVDRCRPARAKRQFPGNSLVVEGNLDGV
jgi:tetratricopeptide (TPR) repeat protein